MKSSNKQPQPQQAEEQKPPTDAVPVRQHYRLATETKSPAIPKPK